MQRIALPLITLGLLVAGCDPKAPSPAPTGMSDEAILKELATRVDAAGPQISTTGPMTRRIDYIVRREVDGAVIACGYSSRWEARPTGGTVSVGWPIVFVAAEKLFLREDLAPADFTALQNRLCGPDWVGETLIPAVQ